MALFLVVAWFWRPLRAPGTPSRTPPHNLTEKVPKTIKIGFLRPRPPPVTPGRPQDLDFTELTLLKLTWAFDCTGIECIKTYSWLPQ